MACSLRTVFPDFEGATGQRVKLTVRDQIGVALIVTAEYNGKQLVPADQGVRSIEFDLVSGPKSLKLVFAFTASTAGRGELREDCGGGESQFLRALAGHEPFQLLRMIGR